MTTKKAVAVPKSTAQLAVHPGQVIMALATQENVDVDKMHALFELQTKYEANEARKAYHAAMAHFRAIVPEVVFDKEVAYDNVYYEYNTLAGTLKQIQDSLKECHLSISWTYGTTEKGDTLVTCIVTHAQGHSESTSLAAAADNSGKKNAIQAVKSTTSYLRRITMEGMLGLAAKADDDDGQTAVPVITDKQYENLTVKVAETDTNMEELCKTYNVEHLSNLPADLYRAVMTVLNAKAKLMKQEAENAA